MAGYLSEKRKEQRDCVRASGHPSRPCDELRYAVLKSRSGGTTEAAGLWACAKVVHRSRSLLVLV